MKQPEEPSGPEALHNCQMEAKYIHEISGNTHSRTKLFIQQDSIPSLEVSSVGHSPKSIGENHMVKMPNC